MGLEVWKLLGILTKDSVNATVRTEATPKREWTVGLTAKASIWLHRRANEAALVMIEHMAINDCKLKIVLGARKKDTTTKVFESRKTSTKSFAG
jgi:hypothetical protein